MYFASSYGLNCAIVSFKMFEKKENKIITTTKLRQLIIKHDAYRIVLPFGLGCAISFPYKCLKKQMLRASETSM